MSDLKTSLSPEFIEQQRKRLETLRTQLSGGEATAIAEERRFQEEHVEEARESEDRAQDMARNEIDQARHEADKRRLSNIERALQKIDQGTYGYSDLSGKPIPKARLEVAPEATLSVEEEGRAEKQ